MQEKDDIIKGMNQIIQGKSLTKKELLKQKTEDE